MKFRTLTTVQASAVRSDTPIPHSPDAGVVGAGGKGALAVEGPGRASLAGSGNLA